MTDYEVKVTSAKPETSNDWADRKAREAAAWIDARIGVRFWTGAGLIAAGLLFGTPHLLIQYQCYGWCNQGARETGCQYLGIRGWRVAEPYQGKCPRVRLL